MSRSGCFEILTICPRCGQPVPMNGPFRCLFCSSCLERFSVPEQTITTFLNDFEEEYTSFAEGAGTGGTMIDGAGKFEYSYLRLSPRCGECGKPLKLPEYSEETKITCRCGREYQVYPAPEWLTEQIHGIRQFICSEREKTEEEQAGSVVLKDSQDPVIMGCPGCGGALSIGTGSERIMRCEFCDTETYIPDTVWNRIHPVEKAEEWFAVFDGKTSRQILDEQRLTDVREQKEALKKWRPVRHRTLIRGEKIRLSLLILGVFALLPVTAGIMELAGASPEQIGGVVETMSLIVVFVAFLAITLASTFYIEIAYRWGYPGKCRKAMEELSALHGWKHGGREHKQYMGSISARYRGCEFEMHPDSDYAIEVNLNASGFYLKTEPPAYPPDDLLRFTADDQCFNDIFPVRYANPAMIRRLRTNQEELLKPFRWFLDRWESKLAKMKVSRSTLEAHLGPGDKTRLGVAVRFIYPEELEPFLEDMITLARAIESLTRSEKPDIPE